MNELAGHSAHYRVRELVSREVQPSIELDPRTGVLQIEIAPAEGAVEVFMDDDEIVVFRNAETSEVLGLEVPHYFAYWHDKREQLIKKLTAYAPQARRPLLNALSSRFAANQFRSVMEQAS